MSIDENRVETESTVHDQKLITLTRGPVGIAGLVVAAGIIGFLNGSLGIAVGGVVLAIGLVTPAPLAFGVGVAGLLVSTDSSLVPLTIGGIALASVFVDQAMTSPTDSNLLAAIGLIGVILAGVTGALLTVWPIPIVAVTITLGVAGSVYLIHRYERVTLGLVSDIQ